MDLVLRRHPMLSKKTVKRVVGGLLFALLWLGASDATAACEAPPATAPIPTVWLETIVTGLSSPVHMTHAPNGGQFIVEQSGTIVRLRRKQVVDPPFLDIRDRVESGGEKGLLSVAFHPNFAANGRFFVYYTGRKKGKLKSFISEFHAPDSMAADPSTERVIYRVGQPFDNHNGGLITFGPDGMLWIGTGDGGSANDPHGNAQNLSTKRGAILRIDVDETEPDRPFAIPPDNPFVGMEGARGEIWAFGFRNPWRMSFDTETGDLWVGDVGQSAREEVDLVVPGGNYGWNVTEGSLCTPNVSPPDCDQRGLEPPISEYGHDQGCSVTGGFVYRGSKIPELCGVYVYGDFCSGRIWGFRQEGGRLRSGPSVIVESGLLVSSFGTNRKGELRVVGLGGTLHKIVALDRP